MTFAKWGVALVLVTSGCPTPSDPSDGGVDAPAIDGPTLDTGGADTDSPDAPVMVDVLEIADTSAADGGEPDAGELDGGVADGGETDAGELDAGLPDAGPADGGPTPTGVTCIVEHRSTSACVPPAPETYTDVPFGWYVSGPTPGPVAVLTSPLNAFQVLYSTTSPPPFTASNADGSRYAAGPDGPNITRTGTWLDVDIDTGRAGGLCVGTVPLIHIRCTGTTIVPPPRCHAHSGAGPIFGFGTPPPLTCTVRRRDASCVSLPPTTEAPRFWTTAGSQGAESVLVTDTPFLVDVTGSTGTLSFFQESPCDSYVRDVATGWADGPRIFREGAVVGVALSGYDLDFVGPTTCRDSLGNPQPVLTVQCGYGTVVLLPGAP